MTPMLESIFQDTKTVSAAFEDNKPTNINGVTGPANWLPIEQDGAPLVVEAVIWTGTAKDAVLSERLRAIVDKVMIARPRNITVKIPDTAKVIINNDEEFSIIHMDDIAEQNEVLMFPLSRFS